MTESKSGATDRLRAEGRWEAASQFRDEKRRQFKAGGTPRVEANEAAWEAMLAEYPPLPPSAAESAADCPAQDAETIAAILARTGRGEYDALDDVAWVYDHLGDDPAVTDFPGLGAWSLWEWARANRARFYEGLWPKAEAVRGRRDELLHDPVVLGMTQAMDGYRASWAERWAEELPDVMSELAFNAMCRGTSPQLNRADARDELAEALGGLMYHVGMRYVAEAVERPVELSHDKR